MAIRKFKSEFVFCLDTLKSFHLIFHTCQVSASNESMYQVLDESNKHVVDLNMMTCTCNMFQIDSVPCLRALAVIGEVLINHTIIAHTTTQKECYSKSYIGFIVPLRDRAQWKADNYGKHDKIFPPNLRDNQVGLRKQGDGQG
ncbi:uncharacterized protein LOC111371917 [Olea europaea var. sylvestris]|uniref:uncharacterized protein LOC111371917 n=1 Tax=Olea europaea var. sylvestris TaxID=158386 RepID=UPI000C1D3F21|nr:uncharacterized protein LOC111371917 [Olea europaea var. sylvestris]